MTILPEPKKELEPEPILKNPSGPFVGGDLSSEEYAAISGILQEQKNFTLDGYKDLCIKRRIAARIRAVGQNDSGYYIELLRENPQEQERLLASLSVHVSQFFRNPSTYAVLEKKVLPDLLQRARRQKSKLRIWSIGCANGEEPYSIALLCQRLRQSSDLVSIVGTDLSPEALQRAKRAHFSKDRVAGVPEKMLRDYFELQADTYRLNETIKTCVRFFRHDILSDQPFYRADLILCRNVMIYFSREQQQKILQILAAALPQGGYLVLGRAETLVPACRDLFRCINPAERIYQRFDLAEG